MLESTMNLPCNLCQIAPKTVFLSFSWRLPIYSLCCEIQKLKKSMIIWFHTEEKKYVCCFSSIKLPKETQEEEKWVEYVNYNRSSQKWKGWPSKLVESKTRPWFLKVRSLDEDLPKQMLVIQCPFWHWCMYAYDQLFKLRNMFLCVHITPIKS